MPLRPGRMAGWWCTPVSHHTTSRPAWTGRLPALSEWATSHGHAVAEVVAEVGSGLNGKRPKLQRVLSDPSATVVVVEHRDRLARFGVEHLEAALSAQGRRIIVTGAGETTDDLVRDMIDVLTSMCARRYGRRGARNRAMRAVTATRHPDADEVADAPI